MAEHSHEFHLYRVTVHPTRESLLATRARLGDKPQLLKEAVLEAPKGHSGRTRWAISNVEEVGSDALSL